MAQKSKTQIANRLSNPDLEKKEDIVRAILKDIQSNGDKALAQYSKKFDSVDVDLNKANPFKVEINAANPIYLNKIDSKLKQALEKAHRRVQIFHEQEYKQSNFARGWSYQGELGESLGLRYQALDSVAIYIPGGQAPLLSTVLMTAVPAKVAGVKRIVMISPPPINEAILAAAELARVDEVYAIGGAQAIAALAYGTESIKPVDKIVGPGNIYVTLAKKAVFGKVGIDGIYGPSELAVIADDSASPKQIAADLLAQLEHGSGLESVLLVSTSSEIIKEAELELKSQLESLRKVYKADEIETIYNSFKEWSALIKVDSMDEAADIINDYAPEHLEIFTRKSISDYLLTKIRHAGAIFIGANSCESFGDYIAGPSHCLPTASSAKFASGLQCMDFFKRSSLIDFSSIDTKNNDFQDLIKDTAIIARAEGLEAHARAAEYRE